MTTWKSGGHYGKLCHEVTNEDGTRIICAVWVKQFSLGSREVEPYPEGKANFRLILKAPKMLAALNMIAEGAIVSPDQTPEKIAEQALHLLQLAREQNCEYLLHIGTQQQRAERAEAALEAIRDQAECILQPLPVGCAAQVRWEKVRDRAVAAIEATKGESSQ